MKLALSLFSAALLAGCASTPPRPASVERGDDAAVEAYVTKLIHHEMETNAIAGLSIALVDDQRVVWAAGFGFADLNSKTPASADTLYRIGSISKLFTATAALQLAEQGRLDIDKPVRSYVPDFTMKSRVPDQGEITVRQLMTHHAGLPRDRLKGFMNPSPPHFTSVVRELRNVSPPYPPALMYSYSNLGFSLLGHVIENASGVPYEDHMRRALLIPLGMTASSFTPGLSDSSRAAKGYQGRQAAFEFPLRDVPAGGLNSSVNELGRFMAMLFAGGVANGHRILGDHTIAEMLRPQNTAAPLDLNFHVGLGWMLSTLGSSSIQNAGTVAHHAGGTALFHSQMYILPRHKLGVVVLANSSTARQAVDRIANAALALALEAKAGIRQPEHTKPELSDAPLPASAVGDFVGDYTTIMGHVKIHSHDKGLRADVAGHEFSLVQRADGLFGLNYTVLGIVRLDLGALGEIGLTRRVIGGRDSLVARVGEQEMLVGQRLVPPTYSSAWRRRLGGYEIVNQEGDRKIAEKIRLVQERGLIFVELFPVEAPGRRFRVPLIPVSDQEALLPERLADHGESLHAMTEGDKEWLEFSGYRLTRKAP